ncbi:MAG: D-aminoacylase, partial [Pseudomonadota bacterium]
MRGKTMQRAVLATLFVLTVYGCGPKPEPEEAADASGKRYDLLFVGGRVVDGLGNDAFDGQVAVKGDRILAVSGEPLDAEDAAVVIDISDQVIAPGFIDNHAHVQTEMHNFPLAENFTRQGITTLVASLHSGDQPWPLDDYASRLVIAPNIAFFAGHNWTRKQVLGLENRAPDNDELQAMRDLVERSMQQGAMGFSTGLLYVPGHYAETDEIVELAKVASRYGGIYVTHMRNEATGLLDSVNETIQVAVEADIPAHINHHKAAGTTQWGWSVQSLALIDDARSRGIDITHDLYPYTASATRSAVLFPQWVLAGGTEAFAARVTDPEQLPQIRDEMREIFTKDRTGGDLSRIQFRVLPSDPSYNGKRLSDMAADRGLPNTLETGIDLAIELQLAGGFSVIFHAMDEADVIRIMQHPLSRIETDGDPVAYGDGFPHPR